MWKWGLGILLAGLLSYSVGSHAAFINSQIGGMVGDIVDAVTFQLCPTGDRQLVLEYENEDKTEEWAWFDCVGSQCLPGIQNIASVNTGCAGSPGLNVANCTGNEILSTNVNVFIYDADIADQDFVDGSTMNVAEIGDPCGQSLPAVFQSSCVFMSLVVASDVYERFYVSDLTAAGPNRSTSLCSMPPTGTATEISNNCFRIDSASNQSGVPIDVDETTNQVLMNNGSFNNDLSRWPINSSSGLVSDATQVRMGVVPYSTLVDSATNARHTLSVIPGGDFYLLRRDGIQTHAVGFSQTTLLETNDLTFDLDRASALYWSVPEQAFYLCGGSGVAGTSISLIKFQVDGTVLASKDFDDIETCEQMRIDQETNQVYIVTFTANFNLLREIDPDTLDDLRTLQIPSSVGSSRSARLSIYNDGQKIFGAARGANVAGHTFSVSTCSSIG